MKTKKIILFGLGTLLSFLTFYSGNLISAADSSIYNSQSIKVIKPSSGTKIKEENDITINWKEYKGEFDHYRISLRNKLVPDLITSGQVVNKENKEFIFNGESLTAHHVEFWYLNSGGILLNKLRKNFYFEIVAINSSMQPVATGYSKTFSIIENTDKNSVEKDPIKNDFSKVEITSPKIGGPDLIIGKKTNIKWTSDKKKFPQVDLWINDTQDPNNYQYIATNLKNKGKFSWKIPEDLKAGQYQLSIGIPGETFVRSAISIEVKNR